MPLLTIYGDPISGNCLKVKWTADLLDIPYTWSTIDVVAGDAQTPGFLTLNPFGKVPFVRWADGRSLTESNAIMLYLADIHGASSLVPADSFLRAQMMAWLFWEQYSHEPYIAVRRFKKVFQGVPDDQLDPSLLTRGHAALSTMERQLSSGRFMVGNELSLADLALVAYTQWAADAGFDVQRFPHVQEWVARVLDHIAARTT